MSEPLNTDFWSALSPPEAAVLERLGIRRRFPRGHALLQQQAGHAVEAGETRHLARRAVGIGVGDVGE